MPPGNLPSTTMSNAAASAAVDKERAGQMVEPPSAQVNVVPRLVRQAYSGPMGYTGGSIAGGPMSGFSGMMGAQQQQQAYMPGAQQQPGGYMGGGLSPQMMMGGGLAPPQLQTTAGLVQQYNPFAGPSRMPTPQALDLTAATEMADFGGAYGGAYGGEMYGGEYEMEPNLPTSMGLMPGEPQPAGEYGTVTGPIEYDPETQKAYSTYEDPEPGLPLEEGQTPESEGWEAQWNEQGEVAWYTDPKTGDQWQHDEEAGWVQANLKSGDLTGVGTDGVDDATYQYYMGENLPGFDASDKFQVGPGGEVNTEIYDELYAQREANRQNSIGAATRAFRDWANRSGIAFNPAAMGQAASQFESMVLKGKDELDTWHGQMVDTEERRAEAANWEAYDMYGQNIDEDVAAHMATIAHPTQGEYGVSQAYQQFVSAHVERMKSMDMGRNAIATALNGMLSLFNASYPDLDAVENRANPSDFKLEDSTGEENKLTGQHQGDVYVYSHTGQPSYMTPAPGVTVEHTGPGAVPTFKKQPQPSTLNAGADYVGGF